MDLLEYIHSVFVFNPPKTLTISPVSEGVSFEEVFINTFDGEVLYGYITFSKTKTKSIVIFLHGNGENADSWSSVPLAIQKHISVNFLVVDYRGYGRSTGFPTRHGVVLDAESMYDFLINRGYKSEDISLFGMSLGGAIALELAVRREVNSIVLQSSFTSLKDVAKNIYPFIPRFMVKNDFFNSKSLIKDIRVPVLISHGDCDKTIPVKHSLELYETCNEPKKLIILKGASHTNVAEYFNDNYFETLRELIVK